MLRFLDRRSAVYIIAVGSNIFWGLSGVVSKIALTELSVMQVLAGRWLVSTLAILALAAVGVVRIRFKGKRLWPVLVIALLQPVLSSVCETAAIDMTTASQVSVMNALTPSVVAILAFLFLKKRIHKTTVLGIALSFLGIAFSVVCSEDFDLGGKPLGYAAMVVTVLCGAIFVLGSSRCSKDFSPMELTLIQSALGAVVFNAAAGLQAGGFGWYSTYFTVPEAGWSVLYLGAVGSCLCYIAFHYTVARIPEEQAAQLQISIICVTGVIAGVVVLHDSYGWQTVVGMVAVVWGVILANRTGKTSNATDRRRTYLPANES